jgi:hypothetical protein
MEDAGRVTVFSGGGTISPDDERGERSFLKRKFVRALTRKPPPFYA